MDAQAYQGLFYFSAGVGTFTTLLFGLRSIGLSKRLRMQNTAVSTEGGWHRKEQLRLIEIIEETHNIKTFRLQRLSKQLFPVGISGQFLSFQIGDNEKLLRSYSLSNSATNIATIQVSIKKIDGGVGSSWFHERKVGDLIWTFPPNGLFTDHAIGHESPRVFVGGGIGITPLLSMILTNIDSGKLCPMRLFYAVRSKRDLAFHNLLTHLAARHRNLTYYPVLSDDDSWSGHKGLINTAFIKANGGISPDSHFFFCAPEVMTNRLVEDLMSLGVPEEHLHTEKFASPTAFNPESIPVRKATVRHHGTAYQYEGKETLLEFLERQGATVSFACRVGVCGTCKCQGKGQFITITDAGLTIGEKRQGMILTCVAFPEGEVELT